MGERERSALRARLALLAGVAPLLCAAPARAEPFQTGGAGVFVGYSFGEGGGLEWGVEGFATRYFAGRHDRCGATQTERAGFGPLLRFSFMSRSRFEITLAGHAGTDLPDLGTTAVGGELGASALFEGELSARFGPRYGALLESAIFNVHARQAWLFPLDHGPAESRVTLGGGLRYLPTLGDPFPCSVNQVIEGRPYRDGYGAARRARVALAPGFDGKNPRATRWAQRAAEECASVPAFLQLAQELLDLGAPLDLVARAVHAADEELGHTRVAVALAERFGKAPIRLSPPPVRERRRLPRALALRRLAAESWQDGCVNEGHAAAALFQEARRSDSALEFRLLTRVAREEVTHAALAFDVTCWAASRLALELSAENVTSGARA